MYTPENTSICEVIVDGVKVDDCSAVDPTNGEYYVTSRDESGRFFIKGDCVKENILNATASIILKFGNGDTIQAWSAP